MISLTCILSPFLAWGDFHARLRFAHSTIPEEKWGTTRSLERVGPRGDWTAVCKDSREQFGPIMIKKSHLAVDCEMKIKT